MRWTHRLAVRLRSIVARGRVERDLAAELQFHLDQQIAENLARGMSGADARAAAMRAFGSVAYTKEECRASLGLRLLDELQQDLRYTVRGLAKAPAFTAIVVLTLALGIGANTTIFTLLDAVVLKPLPLPSVDELTTFYESGPEGSADVTGGTGRYLRFSYPRFKRLEEALGSSGSLAAVTRGARFVVRLPGGAQPQFLEAQLVSDRYFTTLGVAAARGRALTADDTRPGGDALVAVVSDGLATRLLGGADAAVGRSIAINGVTVAVVGVAPPGFVGLWTDSEADVWLPLALQQPLHYDNNSSGYARIDPDQPWAEQDAIAWLTLVARIPRASQPRAIAMLAAANQQGLVQLASLMENPASRTPMMAHRLVAEPFARGFSGLRARFADALFALAAMVAVVLLVTCANVANLLLARAAGRTRDVAIRISLGATTGRLVRQCLAESLVLTALGAAAGLVVSRWATAFLAREVLARSGALPGVFAVDGRVLAFAAAVSIVTAVAFGLTPAIRAIRSGRTAAGSGVTERQAIGHATLAGMRARVVGQLALALIVVFAATLLGRTLVNLMRIDPGFAADGLITASLEPIVSGYQAGDMPALGRRLIEAVRVVPGVSSVAVSRCGLIAGCSSSSGFRIEGIENQPSLNENWVSPRYFATVGIPLVAGREFTDADTARSVRVAIVNETIARRYFAGRSPIGGRLGTSQPDVEIVGVARDAHTQTLHDPPVPMVYFPLDQKAPYLQTSLTNLDARVGGDAAPAVAAIRDAIGRAEPNLLLGGVAPMSARLARDLARERVVAWLAFGFGALTLLLASLGLYGVLSYGVARRTQELGVRMALGARRIEVMRLVLGQSVKMTAAGMALGIAGAAASARYLSGMLFGVAPLDPSALVTVSLGFAVVSLLASYLPARRATRVDPIVALRCE